MTDMEQFYTLDKANEGRRLALETPNGKPTEHWLQVRSRLSDEFRGAKAAALQAVALVSDDKREQVARDAQIAALAALIADWSFGECEPEKVRTFLRNAPQIAERVNTFAGDDEVFFASGSAASTTTPEPK